jgi:membrane-associated HD superfamily phosphohydrolase
MKKIQLNNFISDMFSSSKIINFVIFVAFAVLMTIILGAKYYLFQSIINEDGTSKKDIVATKTIKVVDTFKTEQNKKEIAQKIEPILTPAEDTYIKNNYANLVKSIEQIRSKNISYAQKAEEISILFDFGKSSHKDYILNYLINSSDERLKATFSKAQKTLTNILNQGVTEKDFEKNNITSIIFKNTHYETSKGEIRVISTILEQVIVPNMVFDEAATENAKKFAIESVAPTIVKFEKGEIIVYTGEPVTRVKKDALQQLGYNVIEPNWLSILGMFFLIALSMISIMYYLYNYEKQLLTKNHI